MCADQSARKIAAIGLPLLGTGRREEGRSGKTRQKKIASKLLPVAAGGA